MTGGKLTREELRAWLDRPPAEPAHDLLCSRGDECDCGAWRAWRSWYDGDEYLGSVSGPLPAELRAWLDRPPEPESDEEQLAPRRELLEAGHA